MKDRLLIITNEEDTKRIDEILNKEGINLKAFEARKKVEEAGFKFSKNKYQEALEKFKDFIIISHNDTKRELNESVNTLQELIDKYSAMYEDTIEDAKFLKEVVEPNLKILKETYRCKPVTVLETPDRLEDNIVGNVISNGSSLVDFKKETSVQNISSEWESNVNANKDIDEALLNLDCWIDSNKEDGTTYNAIGWWNMLETFKKLSTKQTPKKFKQISKYEIECPTCGMVYSANDNYNYCPECGQKIDWSEWV